MSGPRRKLWMSLLIVAATASLMLAGCSDDDGPTAPEENGQPANTPPLPTVANPLDELPTRSAFWTTDSAVLRNFSPELAGLSQDKIDALDEAVALEFRLPAGRNVLVADGRACSPEHLQTRVMDGVWTSWNRSSTVAPLVELGSAEGSYYYLAAAPCCWGYADVNCRNFGGHLASLHSETENAFVLAAVQSLLPGETFSIGLTDLGRLHNDWIWTSGEPADWTNWAPGEPNDYHGAENFGTVRSDGTWNDIGPTIRYAYVLERAEPLPDLGDGEIACATNGSDLLFLDNLAAPSVTPYLERRIYWERVFRTTVDYPGGYDNTHSYTLGTSETTGMSFGWSIGISASLGWGPVSTQIETEFHQDFDHEVTVSSEETYSRTYEADAIEGKTLVVALWQLRERFVITDGTGEAWTDPGFVLAGPLPELDQGLEQEYLQIIVFDAR